VSGRKKLQRLNSAARQRYRHLLCRELCRKLCRLQRARRTDRRSSRRRLGQSLPSHASPFLFRAHRSRQRQAWLPWSWGRERGWFTAL